MHSDSTQETKIFEIASTVADACAIAASEASGSTAAHIRQQAVEVLVPLHQLLLNNKHLAGMLQAKLTRSQLSFDTGPHNVQFGMNSLATNRFDADIERQLLADGFHFTELSELGESPDVGSARSDLQQDSPYGQDFDHSQLLRTSSGQTAHHSTHAQGPGSSSGQFSWNDVGSADMPFGYSSDQNFGTTFQQLDYGVDPLSEFRYNPSNSTHTPR